MLNFSFRNPVKLIFGKGQISKLQEEVPPLCRVLLTYGGGSIKKNGVYDQVKDALKNHVIFEFGGIEPNPQFETLMRAVELVKKERIDFLLAIGGGSVIDGTKFIAAASYFNGDDHWDLLSKKTQVEKAIPIGTILTLPATGSEMNCNAVISKKATKEKLHFVIPAVYPKFSILDPTTTFTLPTHQTTNGIIDTFIHTLEQYLTYHVNSPVQDRFAEGVLLTLIEESKKVLSDPHNYEARANLMLASTMGLNGWLSLGVPEDWTTHMIGHEITAMFGIDHAKTLAIIMPSVMHIKRDKKEEKLLQYGERIFGIKNGDKNSRIDQAIQKTREFFESLNTPTRLRAYNITENAITDLLTQLNNHGMTALGEHADITLAQSEEILRDAM